MKVQELFEIADTKFDLKVNAADKSNFMTSAEVDGRTIIFNARLMDRVKVPGKVKKKVAATPWEVEFTTEDEDGEQTFLPTELGGEFKIMSFVIQSLKEFVKKVKPEVITFTSSKMDARNRSSLYTKLFSRALPGYSLITKDRDDVYEITTATKR